MNILVSIIFLIVGIVFTIYSQLISEFVSNALENASREAEKYGGRQSVPKDNTINAYFIKFLGICFFFAGIFFLSVYLWGAGVGP